MEKQDNNTITTVVSKQPEFLKKTVNRLIQGYSYKKVILCITISLLCLSTGCSNKEDKRQQIKEAIDFYDEGNYEQAKICFEQLEEEKEGIQGWIENLINKDDNLEIKYYLADILVELDEYVKAIEIYDKILEKEDNNYNLFNLRSICYLESGNPERALEEIDKAIELDEGNINLYENKYKIYIKLEESEKARELLDKMIDIRPNSVAYNQLAVNLIENEKYDEALSFIEKGLKCEDNEAEKELKFNEAIIYEYKTEFETAYELFAEYLKNYPSDEIAKRELEFLNTRIQ